MTDFIQIITTVEQQADGQALARALVERRLAGCVQIYGPVQSTYRWQGEIETAEEWLCVAKTEAALFDEVERTIRELHKYDVPEILAVPVSAGSADYLQWLRYQVDRHGDT